MGVPLASLRSSRRRRGHEPAAVAPAPGPPLQEADRLAGGRPSARNSTPADRAADAAARPADPSALVAAPLSPGWQAFATGMPAPPATPEPLGAPVLPPPVFRSDARVTARPREPTRAPPPPPSAEPHPPTAPVVLSRPQADRQPTPLPAAAVQARAEPTPSLTLAATANTLRTGATAATADAPRRQPAAPAQRADAAQPGADRDREPPLAARTARPGARALHPSSSSDAAARGEEPEAPALVVEPTAGIERIEPMAPIAAPSLAPLWPVPVTLAGDIFAQRTANPGGAAAGKEQGKKQGEAPRAEQDPDQRKAADDLARAEADRSYAALVAVARRWQQAFVDHAAKVASVMLDATAQAGRDLERQHDSVLADLDQAAERARQDVDAATAETETMLDDAFRSANAGLSKASRRAHGAISANERTADAQISAILDDLVGGHRKAYDDGIAKATAAASTAVAKLQAWNNDRNSTYPTEGQTPLKAAQNESVRLRVPSLSADVQKSVNQRKETIVKSWSSSRDATVCGLTCQFRPELDKHKAAMHTQGHGAVAKALKTAKDTLERQNRDGRQALANLRTSARTQIDNQRSNARSRLTGQARASIEAARRESKAAVDGIGQATRASLPSYWRGVQGFEQALRRAGPRGPQAVCTTARDGAKPVERNLEAANGALMRRLDDNQRRLETSLERRTDDFSEHSQALLNQTGASMRQRALDTATELGQTGRQTAAGFEGHDRAVTQSAESWARPIGKAMAGYISQSRTSAQDNLKALLTGAQPKPPATTTPSTGTATAALSQANQQQPAAACGGCSSTAESGPGAATPAARPPGGVTVTTAAPGPPPKPKGLTEQIKDEEKFANDRAAPIQFFARELTQVMSRVQGNLVKRSGDVAAGLEAGIIDKVDEGKVTGALRALTELKGHALDVDVYPQDHSGRTLSHDLLWRMRGGTDYEAAIAYLSGNAVEGARLELKASMHWYNDEEARIEATMRALSPEQIRALGASHAGVLDDVHDALDGTDRQAFDALRAADPANATGAYAEADAIRLRARIDELRRDGNHDAVHAAIVEYTASTEEGYGGQEVSAEARRAAVVGALGKLVSDADVAYAAGQGGIGAMTAEQRAVAYVTRDVEVQVGGGHEAPPQTITLKMEGANRDLTRDLLLHGEGSVEARASRLGGELQRSGDAPNSLNIDRAMFDERFTPDNPNATAEEREANEARRREARADRAQVLLLAAQRYGGERPPPDGTTVTADQALQNQHVVAARDALISRLQTRYGDDTLGGQLAKGLLTDERPSPATAAIAMRHAMYSHTGTDEELLFRFTERMNRDEIAKMREAFTDQTGKSLDAELGVYGEGGTFTELSGDDRLRMERAMLGVARTDQERLENAAFAIDQQRRETGAFGRWLASGSLAEEAMNATYRRLITSAGGNLQFDRRGNLITPAAFDGRGNYTGTDRATFIAAADAAQQVAQNYSARIDAYANLATTGIMILGAIAGAIITVATGGAAGPLVAAALITGLASMAAQYALKGGRYGWEQAAVDLGMTAVQALTAGIGAQLGAAAQVASKGAQAASQASRVVTTLARMFTGNRVLDQIIIGAITGGISGLGTAALNEQTWARGAEGGIGGLLEGLLKGMLAGAATSAVTNSIESIGIRGQQLGDRLQGLSAQGPAGRATLNMLVRGGARSIISATGGMTGRSVEILFDAASGRFRGDSGDALVLVGEAGLHSAVQSFGEGAGEAHGQRIHDRRQAIREARAASGRPPPATAEAVPARPAEVGERAAPVRPAETEGAARPTAEGEAAPRRPAPAEEPSGRRPLSDAEAAVTMAIRAAGGGDVPSPSARPAAANDAAAAATRAAETPAAARPPEVAEPVRAAAAEAAEASRRSQRVAPSAESFADAEFDAILHDLRNSEFGHGLEAAKRRAPEPLGEDRTRTRAQVDAAAHAAARRAPPPGRVRGAQIQHQTKTLDVTRNLPAGMHPLSVDVINENLLWLQSRRNLPSTLLHVDPHGGGTRFFVDDVPHGRVGDAGMRGEQLDLFRPSPAPRAPDYRTEHKFMDNHLIPAVARQIADARARAGLPPLDPRMLAIAAGEQARWMMEGVSGSRRSGEVVDIAAAATARPAAATAEAGRPAGPAAQLELPFNRPAAGAAEPAAGARPHPTGEAARPAAEEVPPPRARVAPEVAEAPRLRVATETPEAPRVRVAVEDEVTRAAQAEAEAISEAAAAQPRRAAVDGAAAAIPGSRMQLADRPVITDPPRALGAALTEVIGRVSTAGDAAIAPTPEGLTVRMTGADGEPLRIRIEVAETNGSDVANFRRAGPGDQGFDYVVTLSPRAPADLHARALAHELAEVRVRGRSAAATPDVLRTAAPPEPGARLSAHDVGRLAELEVLAQRLRAVAGDPAAAQRVRADIDALAAHLGLLHVAAADPRLGLALGALPENSAARTALADARGRAGQRSAGDLLTPAGRTDPGAELSAADRRQVAEFEELAGRLTIIDPQGQRRQVELDVAEHNRLGRRLDDLAAQMGLLGTDAASVARVQRLIDTLGPDSPAGRVLDAIRRVAQAEGGNDALRPGVDPTDRSLVLANRDREQLDRLQTMLEALPPRPMPGSGVVETAETARLRHQAESLAAELGLVFGQHAGKRATLAERGLTSETALARLGDVRESAAVNPLLIPRTGTADDLPLLARQIAAARGMGDEALAAQLSQLAGRHLADARREATSTDPEVRRAALRVLAAADEPEQRALLADARERHQRAQEAARLRAEAADVRGRLERMRRETPEQIVERLFDPETGRPTPRKQRQMEALEARARRLEADANELERIALRPSDMSPEAARRLPNDDPRIEAARAQPPESDYFGNRTQQILTRQLYADSPQFQRWQRFVELYYELNPSLGGRGVMRPTEGGEGFTKETVKARIARQQELAAEFARARFVAEETGETRRLGDLAIIEAGPGRPAPFIDPATGSGVRLGSGDAVRLPDGSTLPVADAATRRKTLMDEVEALKTQSPPDKAAIRQREQEVRVLSEALGEAAGLRWARAEFGSTGTLVADRGSGATDLIHIDPGTGRVTVIECKGGTSPLGFREAEVGGRSVDAQQTTPEYLRSLANDMIQRGRTTEGEAILRALDQTPPNIEAIVVRQPFNEHGQPKPIEVTRYDVPRSGR